jgi:hypothetical protein
MRQGSIYNQGRIQDFKLGGGVRKKIVPSGGRRENFWGISCENYWSFMKLYIVVVYNLQMCMKKYRCCLRFRRGDNSTYTFTKRGGMYLAEKYTRNRFSMFILDIV